MTTKEIIKQVLDDFLLTRENPFTEVDYDDFGQRAIVLDEEDTDVLSQAIIDVLKKKGVIGED